MFDEIVPSLVKSNPPQPDKYLIVTGILEAIYDSKNQISDLKIVGLLKKIDKELEYNSEYHVICSGLLLELVIALDISLDDPKYNKITGNEHSHDFNKILGIIKRRENVRYYN
jgi:hypothetical protein